MEEPREEARRLYCGLTGRSVADIVRGDIAPLIAAERVELFSWAERRAHGEPLAYLEGQVGFFGLELAVDSRVLIPRADSECLVEVGLQFLAARASPSVLDIGTGSGCLLFATLVNHAAAIGLGVDSSAGSLEVAAANCESLGLSSRASFHQGQWLSSLHADPFDLILCNPPYVQPGEELGPGVEEFEPAAALFTPPEDPMWAYRCVLAEVRPFLASDGLLLFEVGAGRVQEVVDLVKAEGFQVGETYPDLAGIPRAVSVSL